MAFLYLNSVQHFQALNCVANNLFSMVTEKINLQFFRYGFLAFSIMHISTFNYPESSRFCG